MPEFSADVVGRAHSIRVRRLSFLLLVAVITINMIGMVSSTAANKSKFITVSASAQAEQMAKGVNIFLEAPTWWSADRGVVQLRHFAKIYDAGFRTVRLVVLAFKHMDSENRIDPKWLERLDSFVEAAIAAGLIVIVDEHDYKLCGRDVVGCREKLRVFWGTIANRYRHASNQVVFELLNEPNGSLTSDDWNKEVSDLLRLVRETNPTRNIVVGPAKFNNLNELPNLRLPEDDRHIIVTFHYYDPMPFTHQGVSSPKVGVPWGSNVERRFMEESFDKVKSWSEREGRPVLLGEFGTSDKVVQHYRVDWLRSVVRAAELRGFSWCYWLFSYDFYVFDLEKDEWVEPVLRSLLDTDVPK